MCVDVPEKSDLGTGLINGKRTHTHTQTCVRTHAQITLTTRTGNGSGCRWSVYNGGGGRVCVCLLFRRETSIRS